MKQVSSIAIEYTMLAGKGQRFANYLIDTIVVYSMIFLMGLLAGGLYNLGFEGLYNWVTTMDDLDGLVLNLLITVLYYLFMEGIAQKTVGKLVTGTIVVTENGSKPEIGAIAIRTLCRFIPFEAFSFFGETARGWHDSMAKTYVVDLKAYKEELRLKNSFEEIGVQQSDEIIKE